jgi:glycine reductase complex component B subunit alpha and beta
MKLEIGQIMIRDIQFGEETKVDQGILFVNREEIIRLIRRDDRIQSLEVEIAKPGEKTRIIPVKDVIEPRVKVAGSGGVFPGQLNKVNTVGQGRTHVLKGAAVVTTGKVVGFQEGIIDMSGPGAEYTPFSQTCNLVVICEPEAGMPAHDHEEVVRIAGLRAAAYLGEAGRNAAPDHVETFQFNSLRSVWEQGDNLPRVAYVYMLQSQGLLHDTYVYGVDAKRILPTLISPTEVMDGAIVSGNCVSACDKNTTYHHQNNPVIEELYKQHGKEIVFCGVIITNENVTLADKERSSNRVAQLASYLGVDGAVITEEGFGNPDTDLIMNCVKLEELGIRTVLITDEFAGRDGASQSLADASIMADAVVTAGNANEMITLPPMDRVIGHVESANIIAGGFENSLDPNGSISTEIQALTGATNELGFNRISAHNV